MIVRAIRRTGERIEIVSAEHRWITARQSDIRVPTAVIDDAKIRDHQLACAVRIDVHHERIEFPAQGRSGRTCGHRDIDVPEHRRAADRATLIQPDGARFIDVGKSVAVNVNPAAPFMRIIGECVGRASETGEKVCGIRLPHSLKERDLRRRG